MTLSLSVSGHPVILLSSSPSRARVAAPAGGASRRWCSTAGSVRHLRLGPRYPFVVISLAREGGGAGRRRELGGGVRQQGRFDTCGWGPVILLSSSPSARGWRRRPAARAWRWCSTAGSVRHLRLGVPRYPFVVISLAREGGGAGRRRELGGGVRQQGRFDTCGWGYPPLSFCRHLPRARGWRRRPAARAWRWCSTAGSVRHLRLGPRYPFVVISLAREGGGAGRRRELGGGVRQQGRFDTCGWGPPLSFCRHLPRARGWRRRPAARAWRWCSTAGSVRHLRLGPRYPFVVISLAREGGGAGRRRELGGGVRQQGRFDTCGWGSPPCSRSDISGWTFIPWRGRRPAAAPTSTDRPALAGCWPTSQFLFLAHSGSGQRWCRCGRRQVGGTALCGVGRSTSMVLVAIGRSGGAADRCRTPAPVCAGPEGPRCSNPATSVSIQDAGD